MRRLLGRGKKHRGHDEVEGSASRDQQRVQAFSKQSDGPSPNNERSLITTSSNIATQPASSHAEGTSEFSHDLQPPANLSSALPIGDGINIGLIDLCELEDTSSAIVDIVFVHGLTGNAYTTWLYKNGKTRVYWPYELLRKDYPNARILAFGYDADITQILGPASSNRVGNHAENMLGALSQLRSKTDTETRKIIFVAHSLGGLVTECALNLSKASPEADIQLIEEHTVAVAFLGTPHHGSDYAAWVTLASSLTNWIKRSNKDIVDVLKSASEVLATIQKGFQGLLSRRVEAGNKISVTCFFEELPVTGLGDIVPKHSAILPQYPSYGIRANHMDMTKFDSPRNPGYKTVEGEIFKWVKLLRSRNTQPSTNDLRTEFLNSLDFQGMLTRQKSIETAHNDTLHWIWTRPHLQFKSWLDSKNGIFWISGKAGSGKSTIMKRLTETPNIRHSLQSQEMLSGTRRDIVIGSCFLDYKGNVLAKSAEGMLRTLLRQVVTAKAQLFQAIEPEFAQMRSSRSGVLWSLRALERFILTVVQSATTTRFFFLVDALDEYQGEDIVIAQIFAKIAEECQNNLQLCVSSRPHIDFREEFGSCHKLRMELETQEDVRHYTNGRFQDYLKKHGSSYQVLIDEVVSNAQGLFIWVKLASNELLRAAKRGEDIEQLRKRLNGMPQELDEFYQRILDQLDAEDRDEAQAMLAMTVSTPEPLTPVQLRYAVHFATGVYNEFNKYLAETRILAVCGGLLEFGESDLPSPQQASEFSTSNDILYSKNVRLAHRSVYRFLSKNSTDILRGRHVDGKMLTGNVLLTRACVSSLTKLLGQTSLATKPKEYGRRKFLYSREKTAIREAKKLLKTAVDKDPLLRFYLFSLKWWATCAQLAEWETKEAQSILNSLNGRPFSKWREIADEVSSYSKNDKIYSVYIGQVLYPVPESYWPGSKIPCSEQNLEAEHDEFDRVISGASSKSFADVVVAIFPLLSGEAGRVYRETLPETLLEFAASCGLNVFSQTLIDSYSAEQLRCPSGQFEYGERLLFAAARGGSVEVAQKLFQLGVEIGTKTRWTSGCLSRAIYYRRNKLARLFIERGADLYGSGLYHRDLKGSPMEVAIKNRNQVAMELLVERGINLNARICYWGTPLQLAAKLLEIKTVSFLIEMGADVNACVPRAIFGSALEAVIFSPDRFDSSRWQIIVMLLSHGASPAAVRPVGNVPLLLDTLSLGIWVAADLFINYGTKLDIVDPSGHSPIFHLLQSYFKFASKNKYHYYSARILHFSDVMMDSNASFNPKDLETLSLQISDGGIDNSYLSLVAEMLRLDQTRQRFSEGAEEHTDQLQVNVGNMRTQILSELGQIINNQKANATGFSSKIPWVSRARQRLATRSE